MISSLESFLNNFSVRKKSPREVVAALRAAIERAEKVDDGQEKVSLRRILFSPPSYDRF